VAGQEARAGQIQATSHPKPGLACFIVHFLTGPPEAMRLRRSTVEHPFATIKYRIVGHPRPLLRGLSGAERIIATGDGLTQQTFQGLSAKADLALYTSSPQRDFAATKESQHLNSLSLPSSRMTLALASSYLPLRLCVFT